jgi:hypothetical protein
MAGLWAGKAIQKGVPGKPWVCLDCLRTFANAAMPPKRKGGKGRKSRAVKNKAV